MSGPQQRFKWGGFGSVWRWAKGHGHRWLEALNWARRRKKKTPNQGFGKAAKEYARKRNQWVQNHKDPAPSPSGSHFSTFDGLTVPTWIAAILAEARKDGVSFHAISGYRSPAYSTSLCEGICGAPTCPGLCAGALSNHSCPPSHTGVYPEGAVDVYPGAPQLEAWCRAHSKPLYGGGYALSSDPNHFSNSGR
jgi:hypothetical protein